MATFLDTGILSYFGIIFPFILIFAIVFGILQRYKILGQSTTINAIVAVAIAFISLLSSNVLKLIEVMSPWFALLFVFLLLLLLIYKMLGATDGDITDALKSEKIIVWAVFGVALVIIIGSVFIVFGQDALSQQSSTTSVNVTDGSTTTEDFGSNIINLFFSTKILGLIIIFLIAALTIFFLTGKV